MLDRIVNQGSNNPQESFYFQLIPISLTLVNSQCQLPAEGTTYRFCVLKGSQKFDQNRIPIPAEFTRVNGLHVLAINSCRLNFYLPSAPKGRKIEFTFRAIQRQNNEDFPLGDYGLDSNQLISAFKKDNISRHELKSNFSDDYQLEFEIYVDNNRVALEKNIREHRQDRAIKSPLRNRKEESVPASGRKDFTRDKKAQDPPQRDNEPAKKQVPAQHSESLTEPDYPQTPYTPYPDTGNNFQKPSYDYPEITEKAEVGSVASKASKSQAPLVQTKFKPVSKIPAEIKMTDSQRMGVISGEAPAKKVEESSGEKVFMTLFLLVGLLTIYWAMVPSSKV